MKEINQKPEIVESSDLIEITQGLDLRAFLREDDIMGVHLVLYANKGEPENAVGVDIHPSVSKKLLEKIKETMPDDYMEASLRQQEMQKRD